MRKYPSESENTYDDIIHLPHHVSCKRPQMPLEDRAAQFSPFAAVVGHEASVKEAARLTNEKRDLDESQKIIINEQLREIEAKIEEQIQVEKEFGSEAVSESGVDVEIEHFEADTLKSGGQYLVATGRVTKIDAYSHCVHMTCGKVIAIDNIFRMAIL